MRKFLLVCLSLLTVLTLIAGCGPQPTEAPTEPPAEEEQEPTEPPAEEEEEEVFKVGQVTDVGGIDDKSFNAMAWKGMQAAADQMDVQVDYLESQQQADYASNITQFIDQGFDMIVTVGFLLTDDTATFAEQYPDVYFAGLDQGYETELPNLMAINFATDEAAFLAGYLAAGMSETGKVGTFGGIEIPPVTIFMVGYENGVKYYNEQHGTDVEVLGMNTYVGNFESTEDGKNTGLDLIAEGADVILPVAGPVGLGTAAAVQENPGTMLIGVDDDWCNSAPEYCDVTLTSVMKRMDQVVPLAIERAMNDDYQSELIGTLDNGGVSLAPFHEFDGKVSDDLKAELDEIRQGIIAGEIDTGWPVGEAPAEEEEEEAMAPEDVDPLIIGTTDSVTDLDPANSYDFHTWEIHHNTMDTLLHYIPGTTELEPGLAESYEISDDGLEYTFKLREGLSFPDGTPFNADAVVWSINRVMRLEGDPSWLVTSFVDSVEKVDEYTVKFVLKQAVGFFPKVVATEPYAIVSPECYPEDDFDVDSTCGGIGPYKIVRWERDVEMELVANEGYYGDPPEYPHVIVRYFSDSTAERLALEAGDIDVAWKTLTPSDYSDLGENPDYKLFEAAGPYIRYICFNTTTEPFDNPTVRQAISLAIDRDQISEVVFQGTHENLYSMVPMGMFAHVDAFGERDIEQAKALLAEAGFDENNPLEMDLWWTPSHYGPTEGDVASSLKQALEETGVIKVTLQSAEWATYTDYFGPGTMPVFLLGWYPDYLDPDNYTSAFAECDASEDLGIFYCNEEMDALLQGARNSTEQAEREEMYKEAQELWTEEVPTIPFTQGLLQVVTQNNVSGVKLDPTLFLHYFTITKE